MLTKVQLRTICSMKMLTLPLVTLFFCSILPSSWIPPYSLTPKANLLVAAKAGEKQQNDEEFYLWLQFVSLDLYPNRLDSLTTKF